MKFHFLLPAVLSLVTFSAGADVVEYFANAEPERRIEFGTAKDGDFTDGPVQTGVSIAGSIITFHTDQKSVFEFQNFTLTSGKTLRAVGPAALTIRVRGTSTISGTIDLDGASGDNANAAAAGGGGTGSAGGGTGGTGGADAPAGSNGSDGLPSAGNSRGGLTPQNEGGATTQRAGGGGCNGLGATAGYRFPTGAGPCALSQSEIALQFESSFTGLPSGGKAGGGGGGGGGTRDFAANGMNGAGGGGAGGAIRLSSFGALLFSGSITANGGVGGDANLTGLDYGSAGGGGSGGSIWLQTATTFSGSGTLSVLSGTGGQDIGTTNIGGNGSRGVIRIDARENQFSGTFSPVGSADQTFGVSPVTVEFTLHGGPACGVLSRPLTPQESRTEFGMLLFWILGLGAYYRISRARSANSSYS